MDPIHKFVNLIPTHTFVVSVSKEMKYDWE